MKNLDRKKIIIYLRWTVIIVTSYLILFGRGSLPSPDWGHLFMLIYILSTSICRIVTKYQGVISAESKKHIGTTFTIQLPIRRDP